MVPDLLISLHPNSLVGRAATPRCNLPIIPLWGHPFSVERPTIDGARSLGPHLSEITAIYHQPLLRSKEH